MKKKLRPLIGIIIIAALFIYYGCRSTVRNGYPNADRYAVGPGQIVGTIEGLEIDWVDGGVDLRYANQDYASITETARKELNRDETVHWLLDGVTLRIQYGAAVVQRFDNLQKRLTVTLPEGIRLKSVRVAASSADISADPLYAEKISLSVTSGDIGGQFAASDLRLSSTSGDMQFTASANDIFLNSTSGSMDAEIGHTEKLTANATSGNLRIQANDASSATLTTSSGKIDVSFLRADEVKMETTSGGVRARIGDANRVTAAATSGNIDVFLQKDAGFTADISASSGSVRCSIPHSRDGNRYTAGDGRMSLKLSATSGDITLSSD